MTVGGPVAATIVTVLGAGGGVATIVAAIRTMLDHRDSDEPTEVDLDVRFASGRRAKVKIGSQEADALRDVQAALRDHVTMTSTQFGRNRR